MHLDRRSLVAGIACTLLLANAPDAWAQTCATWSLRSASTLPARSNFGAAFDEAAGRIIAYGGNGIGSPPYPSWLDDTQTFDGCVWSQAATTGPGKRAYPGMAYDSARDRVVLFAGEFRGSELFDTWEWDDSQWTLRSTTGPGQRYLHAMAYDSDHGLVLVHGGSQNAGVQYQDTWAWDGASWSQLTSSGPGNRNQHTMAYDSARHRMVMFGGHSSGTTFGDTWEWDGQAWTRVATTGPAPRSGHGMCYDRAAGRIVLFGGAGASGQYLSDCWTWDGRAWIPVAASGPGARTGCGLVFDTHRGVSVLVGGWDSSGYLSDTWELRLTAPAAIQEIQTEQTVVTGGRITLFVRASGSSPLAYQWLRDGVALTDDGRTRGSTDSVLTIDAAVPSDAGRYSVSLSGTCGLPATGSTTVSVRCPADLNGDGLVDFADYLEFLNLYDAGC